MLRKSGIILKQDGYADARTNERGEKTTVRHAVVFFTLSAKCGDLKAGGHFKIGTGKCYKF